ncbi:MAG: nuclear transport factor 2 family protein [Candidatus Lambdaproteobacteria bacterium]|nr:nuclear transport factor 2 family protein [Candidatus Lambdaproteobacteria bacterium]
MTEQDAKELVRRYLDLMAERRVEEARACLADGVQIVFPGEFRTGELNDIIDYGRTRYTAVRKHYREAEAYAMADGAVRVIQQGTLHGITLKGARFDGIRYVDIFLVRDGRIERQEVYNDVAESGLVHQ